MAEPQTCSHTAPGKRTQFLQFGVSSTSHASFSLLLKACAWSTLLLAWTLNPQMESTMMPSASWWGENDRILPSTANPQQHYFPLMELPGDLRNVIYRHALDHSVTSPILPRWKQRWHEYTTGHPVATGRIAASSFTNLQLSSRQVYHEASYILYQTCQFSFNIDPRHASFLDGCLSSGSLTLNVQDKSYIHRITNIVLKADWERYDWARIRKFIWTDWRDVTFMVCSELQGFSGLRRLTLDWKVPDPCDVLQPTKDQWLSISPYFEWLQKTRPDICMEVLAWEIISWSVPFRYREIRRGFGKYTQELLEATERPQYTPEFLPKLEYSNSQGRLFFLPHPRYPNHQWPRYVIPIPGYSCNHRPFIHYRPLRNPFANSDGLPPLPSQRRSL